MATRANGLGRKMLKFLNGVKYVISTAMLTAQKNTVKIHSTTEQ